MASVQGPGTGAGIAHPSLEVAGADICYIDHNVA